MIAAIIVSAVLALFLVFDGFRVRGRLAAAEELEPSADPVAPNHRFLVASGVKLDDATRRAASAYAKKNGKQLVDLIPEDLGASRLWALFQFLDPVLYRKDRIGKGITALHAVLVDEAVLTHAKADAGEAIDPVVLARTAARLKRYAAPGSTDVALAPDLKAIDFDPSRRLEILRAQIGEAVDGVIYGVPMILAVIALVAWFARPYGLAVVVAFHLQPVVAFLGNRVKMKGLPGLFLFRSLIELVGWLQIATASEPKADRDAFAKRAEEYVELTKNGIDAFFEPRRDDCPLCHEKKLRRAVVTGDIIQHKPGRFVLDRCGGCGHVFQNPRLSLDGLNFYYKDFYDGFGEEQLDAIFGASLVQYHARAQIVIDSHKASRWLDVGGGHGHFCRIARSLSPATTFDGLDLSESIEEAERRGWIDHGYRGLFPEVAPSLAGKYDVVSMSHYLEHTRDPEAEIAAAATTLADDGVLLVEVPDPDCPMGGVLGRLWLPWFQPQHQHFVSTKNIAMLMKRHGFEPIVWHRGEAHQRVDMLAAAILFRNWIAPRADVPWRKTGFFGRLWRRTSIVITIPLAFVFILLDLPLAAVLSKSKTGSNTYRVLAKKIGKGGTATETETAAATATATAAA